MRACGQSSNGNYLRKKVISLLLLPLASFFIFYCNIHSRSFFRSFIHTFIYSSYKQGTFLLVLCVSQPRRKNLITKKKNSIFFELPTWHIIREKLPLAVALSTSHFFPPLLSVLHYIAFFCHFLSIPTFFLCFPAKLYMALFCMENYFLHLIFLADMQRDVVLEVFYIHTHIQLTYVVIILQKKSRVYGP